MTSVSVSGNFKCLADAALSAAELRNRWELNYANHSPLMLNIHLPEIDVTFDAVKVTRKLQQKFGVYSSVCAIGSVLDLLTPAWIGSRMQV